MIPVNEPLMPKNALPYLADCIETGWISSRGRYVTEFEESFGRYLGVKHSITTTSGTTALHLALASLAIGPGDEVIIPALTMIATANVVLYTGAKPVLVDSEPETWNMDVRQIVNKITENTKAIIPVHIYGHPVDMDPLLDIAREHGLSVIEDAAESHGAEYRGRKTGSLGDIGCFSFYANKIITTGEGGMLVTNNDAIAEKARSLKDLAHSAEKRFVHEDIGFNYRMTNLQGAVGLAALEEIDRYLEIKSKMAALYGEPLSGIEGLILPPSKEWAKNVYWMYAILIDEAFPLNRDELQKKLKLKGVDTRTFFVPMHRQPALVERGLFEDEHYPVAEELSEKGLYLPSGLAITEEQIEFVASVIHDVYKGR